MTRMLITIVLSSQDSDALLSMWNVSGKPDAESLGINSKGYDSPSPTQRQASIRDKQGP